MTQEEIQEVLIEQERKFTIVKIGEMYVRYHNLRKQIADLKYDRNLDFKQCTNEHSETTYWQDGASCYGQMKYGYKVDYICDGCKASWNRHLEIVKLGHQAGGLKYSLNKLIERL